jgi:hypothetical protein
MFPVGTSSSTRGEVWLLLFTTASLTDSYLVFSFRFVTPERKSYWAGHSGKLLLVLASIIILCSEFRRIHDHILLFHDFWELINSPDSVQKIKSPTFRLLYIENATRTPYKTPRPAVISLLRVYSLPPNPAYRAVA